LSNLRQQQGGAMKGECLSYSAVPHATPLFLDFLYHFPKVRQFFRRPPTTRDWLGEEAASLRYDDARRQAVAAVLERQNRGWNASAATLANIERFRAGASAVVTGQQVGLFGGQLMGLLKALAAARLAADSTARGVECVPVFWMATEDHDLAEINHVLVPADDGGGLRSFVSSSHGIPYAPVGEIRLDEEIDLLVAEVVKLLPESEAAGWLRGAYRQGETFGSAFAHLYAHLLGEFGVVLLDAADPELDKIGATVYRATVAGAAEINQVLIERGAELRAAGYHEQVKVTPSSTLLFHRQNGARVPVHAANGGFIAGEMKFSSDELQARVAATPEEFSPNALLRPVLQDYLLPTVAYFGGPSEVAYFAQAAVVYEQVLGRSTPILPRLSATLVDARAQRLLAKYDLKFTDVMVGSEQFAQELAARTLPSGLQRQFEDTRQQLEHALSAIRESLVRLDPTLEDTAVRANSKIIYQLENLQGRAAATLSRRNAEVSQHAAWLSSMLFPNKTLQEREIAGIWFVARHGTELLRRICEAAQDACPDHQVLYL
jgi:bacillithiol biosynthesis cysteine-adding enzyme BshC